ncbi:hypothetical protein [Mesobacillus jeotgali]|uniref:hypothetical protein n=1 Tax=Mesobacillus jeotgali TaxID=129985 RepID=UPI00177B8B04|nr:hypothetical protein [Mesobacillus jeotgali]UYZ23935.1 hypothetical protein FOF60_10545 [Mesobacillus jeotgali]
MAATRDKTAATRDKTAATRDKTAATGDKSDTTGDKFRKPLSSVQCCFLNRKVALLK